MGDKSKIEWTDATWNPVVGCSMVSPGCAHCYAERMAGRLAAMARGDHARGFDPGAKGLYDVVLTQDGRWNGRVRFNESVLDQPLRWKRPRRVFVCSMSDLFHESVPVDWIAHVFVMMARCPQHTFQVLTKRTARMRKLLEGSMLDHPLPNVWLGVSVEDQRRADERIPELVQTPARVRFLSVEPMLGPIRLGLATDCDLNCAEHQEAFCPGTHGKCMLQYVGIDWVIVGGESGPGARPMHPDWVRSVRDQCQAASVPFFFKQWGGPSAKANGRELDGREWMEWPRSAEMV